MTTDPGSKKRDKKTIGCIFFIIIVFNDFEIGKNQEHGRATTSNWWETRTFIHRNLDSRGHARDFTLLGDSNDRDKMLKEEFE